MQRSASFSKFGMKLDRQKKAIEQSSNPEAVGRMLRSQSSTLLKFKEKSLQSKKNRNPRLQETLRTTVGRQTANPFQRCHTKIQNINVIYNQKDTITKAHPPHFSMKKFNPKSSFERDSHEELTADTVLCRKLSSKRQLLLKDSAIKTTRDLLKTTKSSHDLDFNKQSDRPFDRSLRKLELQTFYKTQNFDSEIMQQQEQQEKQIREVEQRMRKTHSFKSYPERSLLNSENIKQFSSGLDVHNVNIQLFKQKKSSTSLKFDKFTDKIKSRYDRDVDPWTIKLSYEPRDTLTTRNSRAPLPFEKQFNRMTNEVHSKYPIRLAL